MKSLLLPAALAAVLPLAPGLLKPAESAADEPAAGKQVAQTTVVQVNDDDATRDAELNYWLYLPEDYDSADSVPMMLFLHGAGERGDDLDVVKKWGPPRLIEQGKPFPFLVASPQCPKGRFWDVDEIAKLVEHLRDNYKVDPNRIYCTGLSMGGFGTWTILARYPKMFAAGAPICGGGPPSDASILKDIPIWAFHGDADVVVPLKRSQDIVNAIKEAGGENVQLTIYAGVNHNSWTPAYADPELYKWLLSNQLED